MLIIWQRQRQKPVFQCRWDLSISITISISPKCQQFPSIPNKTEDIICNWHWQHWQSSLGLHMVSKRWGDIERRRPNDRILGLIKIIILDNTWKTSDIEEPGKSFAEEWSEKCKSRKSCNQGEPRPVSSLPSLVQYVQYSGTLSSVCKYHLLYTQLPP